MKNYLMRLLFLFILITQVQVRADTTGDYQYTLSAGNATITNYTGVAANLTVPTTLDGYPVVAIGDNAFTSCNTITNILLPDSLTSIGNEAFSSCTGLVNITIPVNVTNIGFYVFFSCKNLTNIVVDAANSNYSSADGLLYNKDKTACIECPEGKSGAVTIPDSVTIIESGAFFSCKHITNIVLSANLTNIDSYTFYECRSLIDIIIPDNVVSIGDSAFFLCQALTNVTFSANLTSIAERAFKACYFLTSIKLPNGVTSVGDYAFRECYGLSDVSFPESVTSIGVGAFEDCLSLSIIYFHGNAPTLGTDAFYNDTDGTVYKIHGTTGWSATYGGLPVEEWLGTGYISASKEYEYTLSSGNATITKYRKTSNTLTVPAIIDNHDVTGIGQMAFYFNTNLTSIIIPEGVTYIWGAAFQYCTNLVNITLPDSLTHIQDSAFRDCYGLTNIMIPLNVTYIGDYAFMNCENLTNIMVNATNSSYISIDGLLYNKDKTHLLQCPGAKIGDIILPVSLTHINKFAFYHCIHLTDVIMPYGLSHIGSHAFDGCSSITNITFPNSITAINDYAFYGCSGLVHVTLPDNLAYIDDNVFDSCAGLVSVTIPDGITSVRNRAFAFCDNLTRVYCLGDAPTFYSQPFYDVTNCKIYKINGTAGWDSSIIPLPTENLPDFPFNANLIMTQINGTNSFVVGWTSRSNRAYVVQWTTNLFSTFQNISPELGYQNNSYNDTAHSSEHIGFYKVNIIFK